MTTPNTITLKGCPDRKELVAGGTITPGHLLKRNSSNELVVHPNAAQDAGAIFALEDDLQGHGIDDNYSSGDHVQAGYADFGDEIYAWLKAGSTAVVVGDELASAGNGSLQKFVPQAVNEGGAANYTIYPRAVVAVALENIDNSGGGTDVRIRVEVAQ